MLVNEMCIPMKKKEVAAIAKELDENGNGIIDFEEFLEWYVMEIIEEGKWSGKSLTRARLKLRKNLNKMKEGLDDWYKNKYPYKRPKVKGGWDALLIRDEDEFPDDIKEVRSKFWWWVREEFGLAKEIGDIDEYRDFTEDEKEAFNTAFKPLWNGGKCKVRFYHDGRRFYHKKQFWLQTWDTKEEKFYWTSESSGKKTYLNPQPTAGELIARNARSQKEKAKENLKRGALWAKENAKWAAREGYKNGKILANKAYHKYQQRGMDKAEQDLYRMGFDRDIVLRTAEMAGTEDFEAAVQQAHYYQVLKDQKVEERRAYLEEHPPVTVRFRRAVVAGYSTIRAWMKGTPQMTEEERRKQAIEMMRLAMYGQTGGPGEDSEVETSDEEKYMMQW